jgi:hypothetical protein
MTLSTGPLTSLLMTGAAVAGSGTVLGGLAAGVLGVLKGHAPERVDIRVRHAGYQGGVMGLFALVLDQAIV